MTVKTLKERPFVSVAVRDSCACSSMCLPCVPTSTPLPPTRLHNGVSDLFERWRMHDCSNRETDNNKPRAQQHRNDNESNACQTDCPQLKSSRPDTPGTFIHAGMNPKGQSRTDDNRSKDWTGNDNTSQLPRNLSQPPRIVDQLFAFNETLLRQRRTGRTTHCFFIDKWNDKANRTSHNHVCSHYLNFKSAVAKRLHV